MKRSLEMKVLGVFVILSEAGVMTLLLGLQFLTTYMAGVDAKTFEDCIWVAINTMVLPGAAQASGFLPAVESDIRLFRKMWQ